MKTLSGSQKLFFPVFKWMMGFKLFWNPGYLWYRTLLLGPGESAKHSWAFLKFFRGGSLFQSLWEILQSKFGDTPPWFMGMMAGIYGVEALLFVLLVIGGVRLIRERQWVWGMLPLGAYFFLLVAAGLNMNMRFRATYELLLVPWWGWGLEGINGGLGDFFRHHQPH